MSCSDLSHFSDISLILPCKHLNFFFVSISIFLCIVKLQVVSISVTYREEVSQLQNSGADSSAVSLENLPLPLVAIYLEVRTTGSSLVPYLPFGEIS